MTNDIDELTRLVQEAPDLATRASLLNLDVVALGKTVRRFYLSTWALGIAVAILIATLPTARFFTLLAEHGSEVHWRGYLGYLLLGGVSTWLLFFLAGLPVQIVRIVAARNLPNNRNAQFVICDLAASIVLPSIAALSWIPAGSLPLFIIGTVAASALYVLPRRGTYDFVGALRSNKPRIGGIIAEQQRAALPQSLVNGRAIWQAAPFISNILSTPAALLLIRVNHWAAIPVMIVFFAMRTSMLALELRNRNRTAVLVQLGVGVVLALVAAILAGQVLWPSIDWIGPALPV